MSPEQVEAKNHGGAHATGSAGSVGAYVLEVRAAWVEFLSTLPKTARILDVGTRDGVVALIASETASALGRNWEIHATGPVQIDSSRQMPDGPDRLAGVTFHAGVAAERLPFEAESFDALCGHYALEDTDIVAALAEIHRVMKPGSDAQFILHHSDSVTIQSARWAQQEADLVLKETKLYRRLHKLVTMEQVTPGTTQRATTDLRTAIQSVKQALAQTRKTRPAGAGRVLSVALDAIQKLLVARKQMSAHAAGREVDRAEEELRVSVRRLNDLVTRARTEQDMATIEKHAAAAGFSLIERLPQYHAGNNLVGWQLLMHRA